VPCTQRAVPVLSQRDKTRDLQGASSPGGPITTGLATRKPLEVAGQACRGSRKRSCGAYPGAYLGFSRSSSRRSSPRRALIQPVVSPTWAASSRFETPELIGQAMCTVIQATSGESCSQAVELGIVGVE
jgi:hypothetical protein